MYRHAVGQESGSSLARWVCLRLPHETAAKMLVKAVVTGRLGGTGEKRLQVQETTSLAWLGHVVYTERGWRHRTWV